MGFVHVHFDFITTKACPGRSPTAIAFCGSGLAHWIVPEILVCAPAVDATRTRPAKTRTIFALSIVISSKEFMADSTCQCLNPAFSTTLCQETLNHPAGMAKQVS